MNTIPINHIESNPTTLSTEPQQLQRWHMVVDGNPLRNDLSPTHPFTPNPFSLSEALIPNIRLLACLIGAQRLDFNQRTPAIISDEADWFAARILLLGVRVFHLDITLISMLKTANQRAQAFAKQHQLPFTTAQMRMSLHAPRPQSLLILETETHFHDLGMIENSRLLAHHTQHLLSAWQ